MDEKQLEAEVVRIMGVITAAMDEDNPNTFLAALAMVRLGTQVMQGLGTPLKMAQSAVDHAVILAYKNDPMIVALRNAEMGVMQ